MILAFSLSMPGCPSWDGKWSGDDAYLVVTRTIRHRGQGENIIDNAPYQYSWSDGWRACVDVREVTASGSRTIKKKSVGFSGYDWMIDEIMNHGDILGPEGRKTVPV